METLTNKRIKTMTEQYKPFYTVNEAAELFGISKTTIWRLITNKIPNQQIEVIRIGNRVVISDEAIKDFTKKNTSYWNKELKQ